MYAWQSQLGVMHHAHNSHASGKQLFMVRNWVSCVCMILNHVVIGEGSVHNSRIECPERSEGVKVSDFPYTPTEIQRLTNLYYGNVSSAS